MCNVLELMFRGLNVDIQSKTRDLKAKLSSLNTYIFLLMNLFCLIKKRFISLINSQIKSMNEMNENK